MSAREGESHGLSFQFPVFIVVVFSVVLATAIHAQRLLLLSEQIAIVPGGFVRPSCRSAARSSTGRFDAQYDAVQPIFVAPEVQLEIGGLSKLPVAIGHGARVGLLARVQSLVGLEMGLLLERLIANLANEAPDVVVDEHVLREESLGAEDLVTDFARDVAAGRRRLPTLRLLRFIPGVALLLRCSRHQHVTLVGAGPDAIRLNADADFLLFFGQRRHGKRWLRHADANIARSAAAEKLQRHSVAGNAGAGREIRIWRVRKHIVLSHFLTFFTI